MDCKKALQEAGGDLVAAETLLRKKGIASAAKKSSRDVREGVIASYIHFDKVGVLVEINCETDFVAKNESFRELVRDVTLQIAAANPLYVTREEVPPADVAREQEIATAQAQGKPAAAVEKIVEGKLSSFYSTVCLMDQAFVKESSMTVRDLLTKKVSELGENIRIRRFTRYQVGESIDAPAPAAAA